jgi:hypothetical protein
MTKAEALLALDQGKTVRHRLFQSYEYIRRIDGALVDSEGITLLEDLFWMDRNTGIFNEGWETIEITFE